MADSFLASEYRPVEPENAGFYVIPCPWERSVSYGGGTAKGPEAILRASQELEAMESGMMPGNAGIYTAPPVNCEGKPEAVLARIEAAVSDALRHKAIPVLLGGEHTATLGALRALSHDPECNPFGVVQFDAHADLREQYRGDKYSHASVMARALEEMDVPLVQIALRDMAPEELQIQSERGITTYDAYFLSRVGLPEKPLPPEFPDKVYITFDVDAFDSSLMPATGTPSPGGLNWKETQFILESCVRGHKVVGLDVMELAPIPGMHHADFTAAKLVHLLMGLALEAK